MYKRSYRVVRLIISLIHVTLIYELCPWRK